MGRRLVRQRDQIADEQRVHRTQFVVHGFDVRFGELDANLLGARDQRVAGSDVAGGEGVHRAS